MKVIAFVFAFIAVIYMWNDLNKVGTAEWSIWEWLGKAVLCIVIFSGLFYFVP